MAFDFSPEQKAFLAWSTEGKGSCVLTSVAGSGKTTTIIEAAIRMSGQVAIMAFNTKIANEIKEKLEKKGTDWKKVQAGTAHSFGLKAFTKFVGGRESFKVDENKVRTIYDGLYPEAHRLAPFCGFTCRLVSLAKQRALGYGENIVDAGPWHDIIDHHDLLGDLDLDEDRGVSEELLVEIAQQVLAASNGKLDVIDFDDMIYLPIVHKMPAAWTYDVVIMDEAQDTNPARRILMRKLLRRNGRIIAVGDRHQAIYGFTGADNDSLDLIKQDFNAIEMALSVSWRCPQKVVSFAQTWVKHIHHAPTAPLGTVSACGYEAFVARPDLTGENAMLCRNTKPLVETAFELIRRRVPCRIEGRDIGQGLKKLATKWKRITTIPALEDQLEVWADKEVTRLHAKRQEAKVQQVVDQCDTLKVICAQCRLERRHHVSDVVAYIDALFADNVKGVFTLSTIHKSKGREWKRVFWLDRAGTCPSKYAKQRWELDQENNLQYVCATRAMSDLVEVDGRPREEGK